MAADHPPHLLNLDPRGQRALKKPGAGLRPRHSQVAPSIAWLTAKAWARASSPRSSFPCERRGPPVVEPRRPPEKLARQRVQPVFERAMAPRRNERRRLAQRQGRQPLPVLRFPIEARRGVRLPALRQEIRGPALQRAPLVGGDECGGAVQKKCAKQRVVLIGGLGLAALDDEAVLPIQLGQDPADCAIAGDPLRLVQGHRRPHGPGAVARGHGHAAAYAVRKSGLKVARRAKK